MTPTRIVHHADAIEWLTNQSQLLGCSMVTSLPDYSEFSKLTLPEWQEWFTSAAALVLSRTDDEGLALFFQSDIKIDGAWINKGTLCEKAAERTGHTLLAHKIVCRAPAGVATFGRPSYSRLLCFSKSIRLNQKYSSPDVLAAPGKVTWARGMGVEACRLAAKLILQNTSSHTVVDPFCGHGSMLVIANEMGLNAIGVELSRKRAEKAQNLSMKDLL